MPLLQKQLFNMSMRMINIRTITVSDILHTSSETRTFTCEIYSDLKLRLRIFPALVGLYIFGQNDCIFQIFAMEKLSCLQAFWWSRGMCCCLDEKADFLLCRRFFFAPFVSAITKCQTFSNKRSTIFLIIFLRISF